MQMLKSHKQIDDFNKMYKELNISDKEPDNTQIEYILIKMYNLLHLKENTLKRLLHDTPLKSDIFDLSTKRIWPSVLNSEWLEVDIRNYIDNETKYGVKFDFKLTTRNVSIYIILFNEKTKENLEIIKRDIYQILLLLLFLEEYADDKYAKELEIYIYKTPFKKKLPIETHITIGKKHLNTGVTTSSGGNAEIVLWRDEEWYKVLIHECMHAFGLDFSNYSDQKSITKSIQKLFPVNSKINLYEGYTETWAKILNCMMVSYSKTNNLNDYLYNLDIFLKYERNYVMFQMVKLLDHMHLRYEDLYSKHSECTQRRLLFYKESTNLFAYFVIGAILMNDYSNFIGWCYKYNPHFIRFNAQSKNITRFIQYIERDYKTILERASTFEQVIEMINPKEELYTSTRFTLIEM